MAEPRAKVMSMILAMMAEQEGDNRIDAAAELALREAFAVIDNLARMTAAAERQAEALERIHARLGFGLIDGPPAALQLIAEQLANIAGALAGKPACPECGAILADRARAHIDG